MTTNQQIATRDDSTSIAATPPANRLMEQGIAKLRAHAELKAMAFEYADFITKTGACPDIYRGKPFDAAAAIIRGTALGFDPDGALEAFFVIHGKVGMYARAMIAVAQNVGCQVWESEASDVAVTWQGTRPGSDKVESVTWTIERAEKAGYVKSNAKYRSNPAEMLRAKCQAELARIIAPGALMGMVSEVEKDEVRPIQATAERVGPARGVSGLRDKLGVTPQQETQQAAPSVGEGPAIVAASSSELKDMIALLGDAGHEGKDKVLSHVSTVLGREVSATKELSSDDVATVLDHLATQNGGDQS